jgi:DNA-binding transcriptional MerR regulator
MNIELTYTTGDVSDSFGIGKSTLNKYSRSLEEHNYEFNKDDSGKRAYTEHDTMALRHLKALLDRNTPYDKAIRSTAAKFQRIVVNSVNEAGTATDNRQKPVTTEISTHSAPTKEEFEALRSDVSQLIEMNKALYIRLEEHERAITDRDANLMRALREIQETKQIVAAAAEEAKKEPEKKSFFSRMFGR